MQTNKQNTLSMQSSCLCSLTIKWQAARAPALGLPAHQLWGSHLASSSASLKEPKPLHDSLVLRINGESVQKYKCPEKYLAYALCPAHPISLITNACLTWKPKRAGFEQHAFKSLGNDSNSCGLHFLPFKIEMIIPTSEGP